MLVGATVAACDNTPTPTPVPTNAPFAGPTSTLAIRPLETSTPQAAQATVTPAAGGSTPTGVAAVATTETPTVAASGPTSTPVPPVGTGPTSTPDVQVMDNPDSLVVQTLLVPIDASQWIQESFVVSPDKKHMGYISAYGGNYVVFLDGRRGPEYSGVLEGTLTFSPDSKRTAYAAVKNGNVVVLLDGKELVPHRTIEGGLVFSPDSQHFAYGATDVFTSTTSATPTIGHFVALDNAPGKRYDEIVRGSLAFSQDNRKMVYLAKSGAQQAVVTRDVAGGSEQEGKPYESVFSLAISPDGNHVGYAVTAGADRKVVIDGQESKSYIGVGNGSPIFSPDSKHTAYLAQSGPNAYFIVLDGQEGKQYEAINGLPVFSPDSKKLAYVAKTGGKLQVVVHDLSNPSFATSGQEGKQYELIGTTLLFTKDGNRVAYIAGTGTPGQPGSKQFVVVKDLGSPTAEQEGEQYDGIGRATLLFSPDGQRLAYVAGIGVPGQGGKQVVVVDGQPGKQYDGIGSNTLAFSTDGKHLAYAGAVGDKQFVVLDGKEGKQYDVAAKGGIVFENPTDFYYLGVRNQLDLKLGNVYLVEHHLKQ
jgi:Tol biopolymer transport system component